MNSILKAEIDTAKLKDDIVCLKTLLCSLADKREILAESVRKLDLMQDVISKSEDGQNISDYLETLKNAELSLNELVERLEEVAVKYDICEESVRAAIDSIRI